MASPQELLPKRREWLFTVVSFFSGVWVILTLGAVGPWPVIPPFPSQSPQPSFSCHTHGGLGHTVQVTGKSGLSRCWVGEAGQAGRTTLCTGGSRVQGGG